MSHVLLVEDVGHWVRVITRALASRTVRCPPEQLFSDPPALIAWTLEEQAEIALVDLSLAPDLSGFQLAQNWATAGYQPQRLIFMTLEPTPQDHSRALAAGGKLVAKALDTDWAAVVS